jgi:hypothetical protein
VGREDLRLAVRDVLAVLVFAAVYLTVEAAF